MSKKSRSPHFANKGSKPQSSTPPHYEEAAKALEQLRQPWNTVIRTAIGMLRSEAPARVCSVKEVHYHYAEMVQSDGRWHNSKTSQKQPHQKLTHHEQTAAVGVVLSGRVEAVTLSDVPEHDSKLEFTSVRPWPRSILRPGMLVGTWEFTGRLYQRPEKHDYRLYAGPVCLQFDHSEFGAFHQKKSGKGHHENPLASLVQTGDPRAEAAFKAWESGWEEIHGSKRRAFRGESFKLIEAIADAESIAKDHAVVLFISLNDAESAGSPAAEHCNAFRRSVVEAAWGQSYAFRSRVFRDATLQGLSRLSKLADPAHQPTIRATIEHLEGALKSGDPIWASPTKVDRYPAINSFVERLKSGEHKNLTQKKRFDLQNLYFANTLVASDKPGCLTIEDYIELHCRHSKETNLTGDKARKKGMGRSAVVDQITEAIAELNKSKILWPSVLSASSEEPAPKAYVSPFKRLKIQISTGLDTLPIFGWLEKRKLNGQPLDLNGTIVIACQHLLRETCCWLTHLQSSGAKLVVIGKDYSTAGPIAMRMRRLGMEMIEEVNWDWEVGRYASFLRRKITRGWQRAKDLLEQNRDLHTILIVDDGGYLLESIPAVAPNLKIRGIEQTTSGLNAAKKAANRHMVVNVAGFGMKREYESKMIADVIIERTEAHCPIFGDRSRPVGVLGLGAIGLALVERLHHRNQSVFIFDKKKWQSPEELRSASVHEMSTALDVVTRADVIFGCAGEDVLTDASEFDSFTGKWFASCGSMDSEFASLLQSNSERTPQLQRKHNPFSTVTVPAGAGLAYVLNGGFPVNFDRRWDSVRLERIQLTRAFMHAAVLQTLDANAPATGLINLDFLREHKDIEQLPDQLGFKLGEL